MAISESTLLTLCALLHDIGKFAQRADEPCSGELAQEYCPSGSTHRHVLYTDRFVKDKLPLPDELEPLRPRIARIASAHHRPDEASLPEACLRTADRLSSGGDRVEGASGGTYRTARLESVFNVIAIGTRGRTAPLRHRLGPIDDGDAIFPVGGESAQDTGYRSLWRSFEESLASVPLDCGVRHYVRSLQSCLERFTWCVPSSTYGTRADISLYDHGHTTAAIAQALYHSERDGSGKGIRLFGGELSGIQKYIFASGGDADKGAGRLLRARSFIVQMLTRSIWTALLERCGLGSVAKIMDAGGRFILLLPDTAAVDGVVRDLTAEAENHLLQRYGGTLGIRFAGLSMPAYDLNMDRFQQRFDEFGERLAEARLHPFGALMARGMPSALPFRPSDYAGLGECMVCGLRPATETDDAGRASCHDCGMLIEQIGRRLPTANYALLRRTPGGYPLFGGLNVTLTTDVPTSADAGASDILNLRGYDRFTAVPVAGHVPGISEGEPERWLEEGRFPERDGRPVCDDETLRTGGTKTFGVLAMLSRIRDGAGWRSVPLLAACKADVDNLGLIFSMGFGARDASDRMLSVSRFASLSRMMHQFFSAWLVRLVEREYPDVYVVFAGGDDLFVIGPWATVADFAARMRREFGRFTGDNPDVTISAGIGLVKRQLPVLSIRKVAEEALEASKAHVDGNGRPKDAATMLGVTCRWDVFGDNLDIGRRLESLCMDGKVSRGFVRRLLGYARECREFKRGDMTKGLYLSHLAYDMARNCNHDRISSDETRWLEELPHRHFPDAESGISWAIYRTRRP